MKHLYRFLFLFCLISSSVNAKISKDFFGFSKVAVPTVTITTFTINPPVISGPSNVCTGNSVTLTATGSGTIKWYDNPGGTGAHLAEGNTYTTPVLSSTTTYYAKATDASESAISNGHTVTVNPFPTVTIATPPANVCSGSAAAFTATVSGGTAPYTYLWNFGNGETSAQVNPTHIYESFGCGTQNFTVNLTVTDSKGCSTTATAQTITIKQQPNLDFTDENNPFDPFNNCGNASLSNPSYIIKVGNSSSSCATDYTINWGDGSALVTNPTFPIEHEYTQLGAFPMTITAVGTNGCTVAKTYTVKNVSNPAGGLSSPGNTANLCAPTAPLNFEITNWQSNSPGTIYTVDYGDGTPPLVLTHPLNATNTNQPVPHSYTTSNCPANEFIAILTISNACGETMSTINAIKIIKKPETSFTNPPKACVNSTVTFSNTSIAGFNSNCTSGAIYTWDFGDGNQQTTGSINSPQDITHQYIAPGTYTVTLTAQNFCGTSEPYSQTICIEDVLPSASFSLNNTIGCDSLLIQATNTTPINDACEVTYAWSVSYSASNCGSSPGNNYNYFTNGTTATSVNPSFNFPVSGTYTVELIAFNSCGSKQSTQTVTVRQPPTATINPIADVCGPVTLNPSAVINSCAPSSEVLTYAWSFPGGLPATANTENPGDIIYNTPGDYIVSLIVTNGCGSSVTATETFTIKEIPEITNTDLTQIICSGSQTTSVTLTSDSPETTFSWTATATSGISGFTASGSTAVIPVQTISTTNTDPGTVTYTITPTLNGCVGNEVNYTITVNPAPVFTLQPVSSTVCEGGNPIQLSVAIANFTGTPEYQWYSNTVNNTISGTLIPGAESVTYDPPATVVGTLYYYCVVTLPSGGCSNITSNTAEVTIVENVSITTQPTASQSLCVGGAITVPLSIVYSGGTGTPSYQWYSNTINSNTDGTLIPGATNADYTPPVFSTVGTYYFYAEVNFSGSGCGAIVSDIAEVIIVADPVVDTQPLVSQTLCQGATPTDLTVVASGEIGTVSYQWYSNTVNNITSGTLIPGEINDTFTPPTTTVGTTYYYVEITQTGIDCNVTSTTAEVIINVAPTFTAQPQSSTVCQGGIPTTLSVAYTNGVGIPTYQWYSNTVNGTAGATLILDETNSTYTPSSATIGTTYYFAIITFASGGGCSSITSDVAAVEIASGTTITNQPTITQSLCVGGTIGTPLSVAYSGGTGTPSYQWYSNTINSNTGGILIPGATNPDYTPPAFGTTGTYYFYAEIAFSGNGCGMIVSDTAEVIIVADPVVDTQPLVSQTLCQGATPTDLTVAATGGIGALSYQWYSNTVNNTTSGTLIPGEINDTFTPPTTTVGTTYYYVEITQTGIACNITSTTAEVIINVAPTFTAQPQSSTICLGQTPSILSVSYANGVATPTYQWYSNTVNSTIGATLIPGETNPTFLPSFSSEGTVYYFVVITFPSGGCTDITSDIAIVVINENPEISAKTAIICSDNAFMVAPDETNGDVVPEGTTYTWSDPVINPAGTIIGASAQNVPQTDISQILLNTTSSPSTVTYIVTPISGTCPGIDFTVTVTVNPSINPNVTLINSTCFAVNNGSIQTNITGGIPFDTGDPYIVSWTGPNGFTSSATTILNLEPGVYNLSVTDQGGCPVSESFIITEPDDIVIAIDNETDITCFGDADGAISISVTGGTGAYTYNWTKNNAPFAITEDILNLSPGVYEVSVSDVNNCGPKTTTFTITEPPVLTLVLDNKTDVLCFGASTGAIEVIVGGGTPNYNFTWTGSNGFTNTSQNLSNIPAGDYNLIVTDDSGCIQSLTVTITQPTEIIITAATTEITCYGANNASITVDVSGGNAPYQIGWSNLATGFFQDNLSAGDYIITITDASGCIKTLTVNIPEAPLFDVNPVVKHVSCKGANDGSIQLNFVGGIAPVTLVWSDGSTAGTTRNNLEPGVYTVTITDGKPCVITRTFIITEPDAMNVSATITHALDCDNPTSGSIDLTVSGGTFPYSYVWSNGQTTEDIFNIMSGTYSVTITDFNGCTINADYSITRPAPIILQINSDIDYNCNTHTVMQTNIAQASGGVPPFEYVWSSGTVSGQYGQFMNTNQNGTVIVTATDSMGCNSSAVFEVVTEQLGTSNFLTSSYAYTVYQTYSIFDPVSFENLSTGDYIGVGWDFGDGTTSNEINPTHTYVREGTYTVVLHVVYPYGCTDEYRMNIVITKGYNIMVPNAFTPNDDGINDSFNAAHTGLKSVQLEVYDTWGTLIYSEKGETLSGWNGNIQGTPSENGNFYYKIKAETFYGQIINHEGPFTLIK